jgi:threonine synthase
MLDWMAVPNALECLRCRRRYPVVPMPAGCPSCAAEAAPSNTAPVYSRMPPPRPGRRPESGVARYLAQLPVTRERFVSMDEGGTPLLAAARLGGSLGLRRLLVKDERRNPTGSWRDRYSAVAASLVTGDGQMTLAGAGDDALSISLAAYAARAGMRSVSLVDATARVRDAIEAVGGRVVGVRDAEARWPLLADAERTLGWRVFSNRSNPPVGGDPLAVDAYRTIAYEVADSLRFRAPDLIVVPAGLGDGIQGIWRGCRDLVNWGLIDRIPRMVAVEVAGAVASALAGGRDWVVPGSEPDTRARSLAGITGTVQTLQAVTESEGLVVRVTDAELEHARIELGEQEGIWCDLAAAAPIAAAVKLAARGDVPARTQIVAVVTGHGWSDSSSDVPGDLEMVEGRVDELLRVLAVRGE